MSDSLMLSSGFGGSNQRKLMTIKIGNLLKENLPKDRDEMAAIISFETGLTEDKSKEYIRLFFRVKKISKDEDDERILIWKE